MSKEYEKSSYSLDILHTLDNLVHKNYFGYLNF
jgi:hypothetical protein